jgi:hypothetical protein
VRQVILDDRQRGRQRLLAAFYSSLVDRTPKQLGTEPRRRIACRRHDVLRQKERPPERVGAAGGRVWPEAAGFLAQIGEDRMRFRQGQSVVHENQNRHPAERVVGEKRRLPVFPLAKSTGRISQSSPSSFKAKVTFCGLGDGKW